MGILQEIAKRAALKTASMAREIPTVAETTKGALVPVKGGLQQAAPVIEATKKAMPVVEEVLKNPGRRKVLKQAAATAARASVPDVIAKPLMTLATKTVVKDIVKPEIPVESIQAAVSAAMHNLLGDTKFIDDAWMLPDLMVAHTNKGNQFKEAAELVDLAESYEIPIDDLRSAYAKLDSLTPKAIAEMSGLPEDVIAKHIADSGLDPAQALDEIINGNQYLEAYADNTAKHKFRDYGFDSLPDNYDKAAVNDYARQYMEEAGKHVDDMDDERIFDLEDRIRQKYNEAHIQSYAAPHEQLLGKDNLSSVVGKAGPDAVHPLDFRTQQLDSLLEDDSDYIDELIKNIIDQHGNLEP